MNTVEVKTAQAKEKVDKSKARYQKVITELEAVMAEKDELIAKELLKAYKKSGKSYDVVIRNLKEDIKQ